MQKTKKISAFLVTGLIIMGVAIFSSRLGLNPGWGKARMALLILGLLVALFPSILWKRSASLEEISQSDLFAFPALLTVIAIYIWFISVSHESTSNYYDLLGEAFRQGELSLPLRPDPALLALSNPYDPIARQGIRAPLDIAFFDGKFYLYWGPAPALLVAIVKPVFPGQISDGYLLFAFICGIFLSQYLFIMHLWERYFSEMPKWIVVLSIFVAGLINPTLWLLSQPKIYETAIAGGQFFFVAGLLSAIKALDRTNPSSWRLMLAGTFWALAVGTRSVLVFPIAFMVFMVVYWFYRIYGRSWVKLATKLIPLGGTLIVGAVAFGWYNWVRFGSISETGFRYALAGPNLQAHLSELFSPVYSFQNLYNYVLNPLAVKQSFPFFYSMRGIIQEILPWQSLPEIYAAQAITGFLCAAPFTGFAIIIAATSLKRLFKRNPENFSAENLKMFFFHWITTSLTGSFLLSLICLLTFFWIAMRYAEDFMPTLTLLSMIGFWQGYRDISQVSNKGKMYLILGMILAGLSIIIGIFLALSIYSTSGLL
jgi:hypothetical protein